MQMEADATRKDTLLMLADAFLEQMVFRVALPHFQGSHNNAKSKELISGTKLAITLLKCIKEFDWKDHSVSTGVAPGLMDRKNYYTFVSMVLDGMDQQKVGDGSPTNNLRFTKNITALFLKSYNVTNVLQIYRPDMERYGYAAQIAVQLAERDRFLASVSQGNLEDAGLVGCHPLINAIPALADCSEPYFRRASAAWLKEWTQFYYCLCVLSFTKSWERAAGGETTLNLVLGRGKVGPQGMPRRKQSWYQRQDDGDGGDLKEKIQNSMHMVADAITKEILQCQDLQEYVSITKQHRDPETGRATLTMRYLHVLVGQFLSKMKTLPRETPSYLQSLERRRMAQQALRSYRTIFCKPQGPLSDHDFDVCLELMLA